ncbi:MAG: alpha/beta hydrolase [Anaerolineae bacterium]|nr:alpha/beta hydrolase [Anaerolineae bacterium]
MSAIILDGEIVHYEVLGRGRPVIFLHGWVGSWRYWIPAMQSASTSYRAYALDLWGFGDTAKASAHYQIEQQAHLLDSFLDEMGIGKVALVGHGLGALVALYYASQQAHTVDRMMMIGAPLDGDEIEDVRLRTQSPADLSKWLLGQSDATEAARGEAVKADHRAVTVSLDNLRQMDLWELLGNLPTAALLVHGGSDPAISASRIDSNGNLAGYSHRIVFEDSGHFPMLEEVTKFNRLLADFLALESGESPRRLQLKDEWKRRVR